VGDPARAVSLWLAGVMALAVMCLQVVPVLAPEIAGAAGLAITFVGPFNAGVWTAALVGTMAAPLLLARFDAWTLSRSCMLLCAAGVGAVASGHVAGLALGAVLIGLGQGLEGPMASHLLATHVAPQRRALWFSVKQTGVQVGAVAASFSLPVLAALVGGWRAAAFAVALLALAAAALLALPAREHAVPLAARSAAGALGALSQFRGAPVLRSLALAAAAFGAMQVVLNGFFVSYAVSEHGASLVQAGAWLGAAQAGGLVGRILWGWVAGRLDAIMPVLLALGLTMSACTLLLGLHGPQWVLLVIFGLSASGWNGIFLAEVARQVPTAQAALATAAVLVVMTLGLVAGPLLFSGLAALSSFATAFVAWCGVVLLGVAALLQARRGQTRS
jgi:MFS family permease